MTYIRTGYKMVACPLCGNTHSVEIREYDSCVRIKDEEIHYPELVYHCSDSTEEEDEFEPSCVLNENLMRARNAYRKKHNLLTSNDIVKIRERYRLSQVELARLLGWGEATISRYESKAIQDESYDLMLRLFNDNPLHALDCLRRNRKKFSSQRFSEIYNRIDVSLEEYGNEYLSRKPLEAKYIEYSAPSILNGNTILNIDKIEAAISYIAAKTKNLFKVKLMKMLWYADCLSYRDTKNTITGLVYTHGSMGAVPIGHRFIMNLDNLNIKEELGAKGDLLVHIYPSTRIDYSILSDTDKSYLEQVVAKLGGMKSQAIIDYMHEETAYTETKDNDLIPFSYALELRPF